MCTVSISIAANKATGSAVRIRLDLKNFMADGPPDVRACRLLLNFTVAVRLGAVRLCRKASQCDDRFAVTASQAGGPCVLGSILGLECRHRDFFVVDHHASVDVSVEPVA